MTAESHAAPIDRKLWTPGVFVLLGLMAVGLVTAAYRFVFGIGAVSNLNNSYPWGIWIGIDVATGVAMAAGGFTTAAALAHIFNQKHYHVLVRPALLTAMLGYTFVAIGLLADLGRFYNIWHPLIPSMWQPNSVLFEVAICVVIYLHVLYFEFIPVVCERFMGRVNLPGRLARLNVPVDKALHLANSALNRVMSIFIIAGVVLSCMHQSSLGALLLIAPHKMHPLWYTPILPMLFLLSAIGVGFPMVTFESLIAARIFKKKPEMDVLSLLSKLILIFLGIYLSAKICDLLLRDAFQYLFEGGLAPIMFLVEVGVGAVLPFLMLLSLKVRRSPTLLLVTSALICFGVALNRVNVFLVAYQPPYAESAYFPSFGEIAITVGLVSTLMFVYRVIVTIFPVLPAESE
jgi:Ni/Fe-hydrogenase subunit HybB-like protein